MNLTSQWKDSRIQQIPLVNLTPMDLHADNRFLTRDLPSIRDNGMWYPVLAYWVTEEWWRGPYENWRPKMNPVAMPTIIDGMILALKIGNNRYQCANHLGYTSIDGMIMSDANECVKLGRWFDQCDPLHTDTTELPVKFDYSK